MEWHLKVPRELHVYWGGGVMPYIRYLTVKTFIDHNPDWKVILWLPEQPSVQRTWTSRELNYTVECDDYFVKLDDLEIEKKYVDFSQFGFSNSISEVHKSDYLRLYLLATQGGVWSDMDIIYFKPIENLAVNIPENNNKDTFVCIGGYGHSAGFLMSAPNSIYYKILTDKCKREFNPVGYQSIGATMFNNYYRNFDAINNISPSVNIDMEAVYQHDALHIPDILNGTPARFTRNSIGIHWYAGHPLWGAFIKNTNGGLVNLPDNIIGNVLKNIK
jgi:mannosyltransferase OCH1-like enzyme